ncbi:hypothetical protein TIFTF001_003694 [Ficus carica]|uniref:Uncharacterized protein n=1 Tax=Ficus carica TaxID=3494 RepID=A0AA88A1A0_FICCA|nr:hypothetical protein TIFTF001_003694 [Ficus carica]
MPETSNLQENQSTTSSSTRKRPANYAKFVKSELKTQQGITLPMVAMNLTWFVKIAITTAFLGRLGELQLAGGALGFTFANVTGFSVLSGLCGAMEPICGQAYGAKNFKLLHKTLLMVTILLLLVTVPISFLWLHVDKVLIRFGQQEDISTVAKNSALALAFHVPINIFLSRAKGLEGRFDGGVDRRSHDRESTRHICVSNGTQT